MSGQHAPADVKSVAYQTGAADGEASEPCRNPYLEKTTEWYGYEAGYNDAVYHRVVGE